MSRWLFRARISPTSRMSWCSRTRSFPSVCAWPLCRGKGIPWRSCVCPRPGRYGRIPGSATSARTWSSRTIRSRSWFSCWSSSGSVGPGSVSSGGSSRLPTSRGWPRHCLGRPWPQPTALSTAPDPSKRRQRSRYSGRQPGTRRPPSSSPPTGVLSWALWWSTTPLTTRLAETAAPGQAVLTPPRISRTRRVFMAI